MIINQFFQKIYFLGTLLISSIAFSQCLTGTSPALSNYSGQDATNSFGTGNISLAGSVMGFTFTRNAHLVAQDRINDSHYNGEYGVRISHDDGDATTFATSIGGNFTFTGSVDGLRFILSDIDNNDYVRIRVFDENNNPVPLQQGVNFSFMTSPSTAEYNPVYQEFYDDDNDESDNDTRNGSISFNFSGKKVSRIEFDYYDTNASGTISFADFKAPSLVTPPVVANVVSDCPATTVNLNTDAHTGTAPVLPVSLVYNTYKSCGNAGFKSGFSWSGDILCILLQQFNWML